MTKRNITSKSKIAFRRMSWLSAKHIGVQTSLRSLWRLGLLAGSFLAGQGILRLLQAICGLLLVRWLSVDAFAVFTIAMALLTVVRLASDFGLTHALIVLGARYRGNAARLGSLFATARRLGSYQFLLAAPFVAALAIPIARANEWALWISIAIVGVVLLIGWVGLYGLYGSAILNIYHDSRGLFMFGMGETGGRLLATLSCFWWPYPIVALAATLLGAIVGRFVVARQISPRVDRSARPSSESGTALRRFTRPLMLGIIYFALQGQISVFLLGIFGYTQAVAEVGALSRLGQLVGLLGTLNLFFVQPHFASITSREIFNHRLALLSGILVVVSAALMLSSYLMPEVWLIILGRNYTDLARELPLALLGAVAGLVGGTLYSVAISRGVTAGQSWAIVPGLAGQVAFVAINGVATTSDALVLSLIPAVGYALVQAILLFRIILRWSNSPEKPASGSE